MLVLLNIAALILGFVLLIKGADFFVDGAASAATKLHIPQIVIGLTIVAFGTSAPEAAVSISSSIKGVNGIAVGNIVGSNIMNVLLILGVTSIITTLAIQDNTIKVDIPIVIVSTAVLLVWGIVFKYLNRIFGIVCLVSIVAYILYLIKFSQDSDDEDNVSKDLKNWQIVLFILGGLAAIIFGSNLTVNGATFLAMKLGVSDRIIGLTIVAFGTSLPELITSITAAVKGNSDISVGNIVGSNLFNILFVLGLSSTIKPVPFINNMADFTFDTIIALASIFLLWILVFKNKALGRKGGSVMLACFVAYYVYLFVNIMK